MNSNLDGAEHNTAPCRQLNREESIAEAARRDALSYVLDDDDDASGILEHHLPMASFRATDLDKGAHFVDEKRAAAGLDLAITTPDASEFKDKHALSTRRVASSQNCPGEKEPSMHSARDGKRKAKSYSHEIDSLEHENAHTSLELTVNTSQPGAFRAGGLELSSEGLERQISERSVLPPTEHPCAPRSEREILVNAELVTNWEDSTTPQKGLLVQVLPIEVVGRTSSSIVEFIRTNRKVQLCMIVAALVVAAMVASMIATIGYDHQDQSTSIELIPTTSPTTMQAKFILDILELQLTPGSIDRLNTVDSPQSKAISWLLEDMDLTFYSDERILQRYALATFYHATGGPTTWTTGDGWLGDDHECSWFTSSFQPSKICRNGTLLHLNMMGNALGGTLPEDITLLTNLVELTLGLNAIAGHIPAADLQKLSLLKTLSLAANLFTGTIPTEIGLLSSLTAFHVANNGLGGALPSEIGLFTDALEISVFHNFFNETIPTEIGRLTALKQFSAWGNTLAGSIPSEVGDMISLAEFSLHTNMLDGTLPTELGKLDRMEIFELQRNNFTGIIPRELGNMTLVSYFNVGDNYLTGTFPVQLTAAENLTFFSLYGNALSGTIPTSVGRCLSLQELYIDNNRLSGTLPSELGLLKGLQNFWAEGNDLAGAVPPEVCNLNAVGGTILVLDCRSLNCSCRATPAVGASSIRHRRLRRCPQTDYRGSIEELP